MSDAPPQLDYQTRQRLIEEQNEIRRREVSLQSPYPHQGANQASGSGSSQHQPSNVEQEEQQSLQKKVFAHQIFRMATQATQMAQDAADIAQRAADMAQEVSNMAARAAGIHFYEPPPPADPAHVSPRSQFIQPQTPQPLDQPIENYQSQFSVAEGGRGKRKKRASGHEAAGSSRPVAALAPSRNPVRPEALGTPLSLQDYQTQLMLLEQAKKKREIELERRLDE
jgi:hypothetical protein